MDFRLSAGDAGPAEKGRSLSSRFLNEDGVALMVVLWVMAFLMFIVVEFAYTMRVEVDSVRNFKDETAARHLAVAGINMAVAELSSDYDIVFIDEKGDMAIGKKEKHDIRRVESERTFGLGGGKVTYSIEDEEGKLNINTASREMIMNLLRETGVEIPLRDTIADSILDWRDSNHEFHLNGAEDEYYGSLPQPYGAKDGDFDTVEELLLVKGMSPEIFYGTGDVPPQFGAEPPADEFDATPRYEGLAGHVTVKGEGKININTADEKVLGAFHGPGKAMEIKLRRRTEGLFDWPMYGGVVTSRFFTITSRGEVNGMKVEIKAIAERSPDKPGVAVSYWNEGITY